MMRSSFTILILLSLSSSVLAQGTDAYYKLGPDSLEQDGVPPLRNVA